MRGFIPRAAWTDTDPGGSDLGRQDVLFFHHTAGPMPEGGRNASQKVEEALIRATRTFHVQSRGMTDIAYNYGVMPSGRLYVLRGQRTGGHTFGWNDRSIALVAFGNYSVARVPDDMRQAMVDGVRRLRRRGRLTRKHRLLGHRDVGAASGGTACPGNHLYALLPWVRRHL